MKIKIIPFHCRTRERFSIPKYKNTVLYGICNHLMRLRQTLTDACKKLCKTASDDFLLGNTEYCSEASLRVLEHLLWENQKIEKNLLLIRRNHINEKAVRHGRWKRYGIAMAIFCCSAGVVFTATQYDYIKIDRARLISNLSNVTEKIIVKVPTSLKKLFS